MVSNFTSLSAIDIIIPYNQKPLRDLRTLFTALASYNVPLAPQWDNFHENLQWLPVIIVPIESIKSLHFSLSQIECCGNFQDL